MNGCFGFPPSEGSLQLYSDRIRKKLLMCAPAGPEDGHHTVLLNHAASDYSKTHKINKMFQKESVCLSIHIPSQTLQLFILMLTLSSTSALPGHVQKSRTGAGPKVMFLFLGLLLWSSGVGTGPLSRLCFYLVTDVEQRSYISGLGFSFCSATGSSPSVDRWEGPTRGRRAAETKARVSQCLSKNSILY